jgi:hypothetical protein
MHIARYNNVVAASVSNLVIEHNTCFKLAKQMLRICFCKWGREYKLWFGIDIEIIDL